MIVPTQQRIITADILKMSCLWDGFCGLGCIIGMGSLYSNESLAESGGAEHLRFQRHYNK